LFLFLFLILYFVLRTFFLFSNNETSSHCFQLFFFTMIVYFFRAYFSLSVSPLGTETFF
jgi:hypothetical protein